jgi:hypothetical protein
MMVVSFNSTKTGATGGEGNMFTFRTTGGHPGLKMEFVQLNL